jgi:L-threonylcarbamoyladenylate synthase
MTGEADAQREEGVDGAARIAPLDEDSISLAETILRAGGLVAIPTETVYGLAADATSDAAVARIYAAKGRPAINPLIAHVSDLGMARRLVHISDRAQTLIDAFWPGPLTLVLPRRNDCPVSALATAGLATLAVRVPKNPAITALIARLGRPLAAPSANLSESVSPTTATHVAESLGARVDLILDGGPCDRGLESTIVRVDGDHLTLLRPGALAASAIERIAGPLEAPRNDEGVTAPGMMKRHYAPRARVRLNASDVEADEAFLAFGPPPHGVTPTLSLSDSSDLDEAARNLFAMLRELDRTHAKIAVAEIPRTGIGEAINDRLQRATALEKKNV